MAEQEPVDDGAEERRAGEQLQERDDRRFVRRARPSPPAARQRQRHRDHAHDSGGRRGAWRTAARPRRGSRPRARPPARTDHRPASLPSTQRRRAAEPHAPRRATSRIDPVSVKNPRFTSCHSGLRNSRTRPPATVSARTSAVTPAGPLMRLTHARRAYPALTRGRGLAVSTVLPVPWADVDEWRSYDDVAETYERIHAPRLAEPARDLVALARTPTAAGPRRRHRDRRRRRGRRGCGRRSRRRRRVARDAARRHGRDGRPAHSRRRRRSTSPSATGRSTPSSRTSSSRTSRSTRRPCTTWSACCGRAGGWRSRRGPTAHDELTRTWLELVEGPSSRARSCSAAMPRRCRGATGSATGRRSRRR